MKKLNSEISYDIIDFASNITDFDILDIASDAIPGLKVILKSSNSISDKLFCSKLEKFINMANEFESNKSFDKFKEKISTDETFKNKVSEYLLLKINKFDTDYKLKIFSNACVDFFNGSINQDILTEIGEVIDIISMNDIKIIKFISTFNDELIPIKNVIDSNLDTIDNFKSYSCILKLVNLGVISEELGNTYAALNDKTQKKITLSPFGRTFYKYL